MNLKSDCTNDEIRHAFAKLSKEVSRKSCTNKIAKKKLIVLSHLKHHPDTSKTNNTEKSSRKFQEIVEAYRVLNKKKSRDAYDAEIFISKPGPNVTPNYGQPYSSDDYEMMRRYRAGEHFRYRLLMITLVYTVLPTQIFFDRNGPYGQHGPYGPYGQHGPYGPYGQRGPYGQHGPYGPNNPFGSTGPFDGPKINQQKKALLFLVGFMFLNFLFLR